MFNHLKLVEMNCRDNAEKVFSFRERKILNLIDLYFFTKLINGNYPNWKRIVPDEFEHEFKFKFFNGIVEVDKHFLEKDDFFKGLESFRQSLKYLECDLRETSILEELKDVLK
jgi:DNA polymerase III sliding clamp (beta) subunit (PCNA family)